METSGLSVNAISDKFPTNFQPNSKSFFYSHDRISRTVTVRLAEALNILFLPKKQKKQFCEEVAIKLVFENGFEINESNLKLLIGRGRKLIRLHNSLKKIARNKQNLGIIYKMSPL
jgi:hypothetical protein